MIVRADDSSIMLPPALVHEASMLPCTSSQAQEELDKEKKQKASDWLLSGNN